MSEYVSNASLDQIAAMLGEAQRIVITTHAKPDGDAMGSVIALARALERMGKQVERWIMPPIPRNLRVVCDNTPIFEHTTDDDPLPEGEPDRIVVLDTGAWSQLEPMRRWLEPRREKIIVIDHHLRGDDVAATLYVDSRAAAVCELVADLIDALGCEFDEPICRGLYAGIASDTGWFRFSNTRPATHDLAARLLRNGINHSAIYAGLEQGERPEKLQLFIRALESLKLVNEGKVAVMTLRYSDFADTGARTEETERLVDLPQIVEDVQVVALLSEQSDGSTRMSFRSKPTEDAVDVNQLARHFGGGGHARASGAKLDKPIREVQSELIQYLEAMDL